MGKLPGSGLTSTSPTHSFPHSLDHSLAYDCLALELPGLQQHHEYSPPALQLAQVHAMVVPN